MLNNNIVFSKLQLWGAANGLTVANTEYLLDTNASVDACVERAHHNRRPVPECGDRNTRLDILAEAILNKPIDKTISKSNGNRFKKHLNSD